MSMKVTILQTILMSHLVSTLKILPQDRRLNENMQGLGLIKIINALAKSVPLTSHTRKSDDEKRKLWESIHRGLGSYVQRSKRNRLTPLRQAANATDGGTNARVEEKELKNVVSKKSELLSTPYIEKKGRNDFLVLQSDNLDPFVTIVPNNVYYDAEKKCVNWLDACSLKGIRAHLLTKVQSPYK